MERKIKYREKYSDHKRNEERRKKRAKK